MPHPDAPERDAKTPFSPIDEVLDDLRQGNLIVLVDDEDRENEGDLVCPAELITPAKVNFMLKQGRGTLCVSLTRRAATCFSFNRRPRSTRRDSAPPSPSRSTAPRGSASPPAYPRRTELSQSATPSRKRPSQRISRPGHVNPLIARDGGVLVRVGQTEGSVDLCRLAGLMPAAAIIEILNDDGTMARVPQLTEFCRKHGVKMCTVADLIEYRMKRERLVERIESIPLRNHWGEWKLIAYRSHADRGTHVALCMGGVGELDDAGRPRQFDEPVTVRVHSECLTGDVFGSMRCDCGQQVDAAMAMIAAEGRGAIVYLRQEGRGIGLENKIKAYKLQDEGLDTVDANLALGQAADQRDYGTGAQILRDIGLSRVRILTNNPKKTNRLEVYGLDVVEQIPLELPANDVNRRYLESKKYRMGHNLHGV